MLISHLSNPNFLLYKSRMKADHEKFGVQNDE
jgi:hypothetical protein